MTTVLVATLGGHVSELFALRDRIQNLEDRLWVTNDHPQTRKMLDAESVHYVPFVESRDIIGVVRALPQAWSLFGRVRPRRVISTGSALALAYLPVAAIRRIPAHYIESITRVDAPSLTGRILQRVPGVQVWWQHDNPPEGWRSLAGLLHHLGSEPHEQAGAVNRILVTVGTTDFGFRRLIERLVSIVPDGVEVFWQTGVTPVDDLGIEAHGIVDGGELQQQIERADVVVTHAGAGSLMQALSAGKVPVYVPRLQAFGEQIDDHQSELAALADRNHLAVVADASTLSWEDVCAAAARRVTRTEPTLIDLEAAPC